MKKEYNVAIIAGVFAIVAAIVGAYFTDVFSTGSNDPSDPNILEAKIDGPNLVHTNTVHKWSGKESGLNIVSWEWEVNDFFAGNQPFLEYKFTENGTHYITLTVKDLNNVQSISKPFEITVVDVKVHEIIINMDSSSPDCADDDSCYDPSSLTIQKGEIVQWINNDGENHNITSGNPEDGPDGFFGSGMDLVNAGEFYEHTFDQHGTFEYFCQAHPWKQGTITVE